MARQADERVAARNREIADSYENGSVDLYRLSNQYGLQPKTIKTILKSEGVVVKKYSRSLTERRPLSNLHVRLGVQISSHRSFKRFQGRKDAAIELRLAERKLGELEQGFYDPSLSEMIRIANWMGTPLPLLIEEVTTTTGK